MARCHPHWWSRFLDRPCAHVREPQLIEPPSRAHSTRSINAQFDPALSWRDLDWMLETWNGPFVLKGVLAVDDARQAASAGVTAIVVSNHGGRQLDHVPATIDVLPAIVDTVGDDVEVLLDSGIRRGSDVVKALALGARACLIGRAYLYGLGCRRGARRRPRHRHPPRRGVSIAPAVRCADPGGLDRSFVRRRSAAGP